MSEERFKVLYKKEGAEIEWRPVCPVQVAAFQAIRDRYTADSYLQVKLRNISAFVIESVAFEAVVRFEDGTEDVLSLEYLDADIPAGGVWRPYPASLRLPEVSSVSVRVVKCKDASGSVWDDSDAFSAAKQERLALSGKAMLERDELIRALDCESADLNFKAIREEAYWLCSCGQPNVGCEVCVNCGLAADFVFELQDEELLEQRCDGRVARQEADRRAQEEARAKRKASIAKYRFGVAAVVVLLGVFAFWAASGLKAMQIEEDLSFVEHLLGSSYETLSEEYPSNHRSYVGSSEIHIYGDLFGTDGAYEVVYADDRWSDDMPYGVVFRWEEGGAPANIEGLVEDISSVLEDECTYYSTSEQDVYIWRTEETDVSLFSDQGVKFEP